MSTGIEKTFMRLLWCLALALATLAAPALGETRAPTADGSIAVIAAADLPFEARQTLRLIEQGGPFPYTKDGIAFGNREGRLPLKPRGYYREYTVPTPGSRDRGARRIIAGQAAERYYTDNHYRSFKRIAR
jgi:ribonuclease T1